MNAAIAALQSGDKAEAINQLQTYATALKDGRGASPASNSTLEAALKKQVLYLYQKHPELRDSLKAALGEAQAQTRMRGSRRSSFRGECVG